MFIDLPQRKQSCAVCHMQMALGPYVTLDHKTSLKCQFLVIEMYTSESWINTISIDVWFVKIRQYLTNYLKILNLRVQKNRIKFLAMHITNQKLRFDIVTQIHFLNIFMEHDFYLIS